MVYDENPIVFIKNLKNFLVDNKKTEKIEEKKIFEFLQELTNFY